MRQTLRYCKVLTAVVVITAPIVSCQGGRMDTANTGAQIQTAISTPFSIEKEWYWPGGGDADGFAARITVKSVSPDGTVQGAVFIDRDRRGLTRPFGEDQSPPVSARWDGQRLVIRWHIGTNETRYELARDGEQLMGKMYFVKGLGQPGAVESASHAIFTASTQIVSPAPDVPAKLAAFSGVWRGYWGGALPSLLIVERVSPSGDADGIYLWGADPRGRFAGGSDKFRAKIAGGMLSWESGVKFQFAVLPDGKLHGERYVSGRQQGDVTMMKWQ